MVYPRQGHWGSSWRERGWRELQTARKFSAFVTLGEILKRTQTEIRCRVFRPHWDICLSKTTYKELLKNWNKVQKYCYSECVELTLTWVEVSWCQWQQSVALRKQQEVVSALVFYIGSDLFFFFCTLLLLLKPLSAFHGKLRMTREFAPPAASPGDFTLCTCMSDVMNPWNVALSLSTSANSVTFIFLNAFKEN